MKYDCENVSLKETVFVPLYNYSWKTCSDKYYLVMMNYSDLNDAECLISHSF